MFEIGERAMLTVESNPHYDPWDPDTGPPMGEHRGVVTDVIRPSGLTVKTEKGTFAGVIFQMRTDDGEDIQSFAFPDYERPVILDKDLNVEKMWRCPNHGVGCYSDGHFSVEDLRKSEKLRCTSTCPCWRHTVIRVFDSGVFR